MLCFKMSTIFLQTIFMYFILLFSDCQTSFPVKDGVITSKGIIIIANKFTLVPALCRPVPSRLA